MADKNYRSVTELWAQSREAVRRNLSVFLILNSVAILNLAWKTGTNLHDKVHGSTWKMIIGNTILGNGGSHPQVGGAVLNFILAILAISFALMSIVLSLAAAKKDKVSLDEVWNKFISDWIWLRLVGVILLTVFILFLGLVALILPGIYLIGRVILAPYILIDQDTKIFEAIEKSWDLTRDRMWQIYNVILFTLLLSLPNIIPVIGPIIAFVLVLFYSIAMPLRYLELKHHRRSPAQKT